MANRMYIYLLVIVTICSGAVFAQNAVTPGTLAEDAPTVQCLGMYWEITGDANRDAACQVEYRRTGDSGNPPKNYRARYCPPPVRRHR